ncbi:hypothetical protein [Microvirga roseola]|uniref:hypothetical protein n=1 Tax=Microvirga roseola TaxID=2883126 RepID=UPI001E5D174B|nr:hypothetical protein [Microvirga roseola]
MARKDLVALYGRLGLIVAAFAFIASIVAGPILQRLWLSPVTVSEHSTEPVFRLPEPVALQVESQG